jgi:hypothetical protein
MAAGDIAANAAEGLIPATVDTYTLTSTQLVITPVRTERQGIGFGATTTLTKSP